MNTSDLIDLKWKLAESKLVGTPSFQNTKSEVKNLRNGEPSCLPPVLKGEYEHFRSDRPEMEACRIKAGGNAELSKHKIRSQESAQRGTFMPAAGAQRRI